MMIRSIGFTTALVLLVGCGGQSPGRSADSSDFAAAPATTSAPGRVMIIGMDGTRPDGIEIANTPNLDVLRSGGFATLEAITGDVSLSGPGWASMLTGVWCDKHRVLDNDATWQQSRFDLFPHLVARLEAERPAANTVSVSHWPPINDEILCADERNDNCGGADQVTTVATDVEVRDEVVTALTTGDPDFLFMQFDDVDHAGHGDPPYFPPLGVIGGFCPFVDGDPASSGGTCLAGNFNQDYLDVIETTDSYIGDILAALVNRPDFINENWLVLVSPDHGGGGQVINQHGFPHRQDRRTFLIVAGLRAAPFPEGAQVKMVDIAATALFHLGVPIDPAWDMDGQPLAIQGAPTYVERAIPACFDQSGAFGDTRVF